MSRIKGDALFMSIFNTTKDETFELNWSISHDPSTYPEAVYNKHNTIEILFDVLVLAIVEKV